MGQEERLDMSIHRALIIIGPLYLFMIQGTYSVLLNANGDYGLTEIAIGSCAPCTSAPPGALPAERSPSSLRAVWCERFEV